MPDFDYDAGIEDMPAEVRSFFVDDAVGLRAGFERVQSRWADTVAIARSLPEAKLYEQVDGEWSLTQTLRHLIYATDAWIGRMVLGEVNPFHPWGQPFSSFKGSAAIGLDLDATPTFDEVLEVRAGRAQTVRDVLAGLVDADLDRVCVPEGSTHPDTPHDLKICIWTVLEEEWWHNQFANRDLAVLAAG